VLANDMHGVVPVSVLIDGYLGVRDVCLSVPCVLGRRGVIRTLPVELNDREAEAFRESAQFLRGAIQNLRIPARLVKTRKRDG
jgi:L-lactate dehydrogenase